MIKNLFKKNTSHTIFWDWFVKHQEMFYQFPPDMNAWFDKLNQQLVKVHPELMFEFSLHLLPDGKREFIISAGGIKSVFPAVIQLVECAPALDKFKITAFVPRKGQMEIEYNGIDLVRVCEKFKDRSYSIEDLYRSFSWVAVPDQCREIVSKAEYDLEIIRFTKFKENWYEEGMKVVRNLLEKVGYSSL